MSALAEVTTRNPLNSEIVRFLRRYSDWRGPHKASTIGVAVGLAMFYVLIFGFGAMGGLSSVVTLQMQTGMFMLLAPVIAHGVIAGERERRSWDLLVSAPITAGQIVAAKFLGPAIAIVALGTAILPAHVLLEYSQTSAWMPQSTVPLSSVLLAHFLSLLFGLAMVALTVLVSALTRKTATAFSASGGTILALAILPPLLGVSEILLPFEAISALTDSIFSSIGYRQEATGSLVVGSLLLNSVILVGSLTMARMTLFRADGDIRIVIRQD